MIRGAARPGCGLARLSRGTAHAGRGKPRVSRERPGEIRRLERGGRGRKLTKRRRWARTIVETTLHTTPQSSTHWSTRALATHLGIAKSMVEPVWKTHKLQPHRVRTFKFSRDRRFVDKLIDVVGLYLRPPEHALVLSTDEKSQIQALDRTQPGLPLKKGRCGTMTHDYTRHGTTTLFAAIEMATGKLIGTCMKRHRHQEWLKFLKRIDEQTPPHLDLHRIADNYSTHKHTKVRAWLARHPRFHLSCGPDRSEARLSGRLPALSPRERDQRSRSRRGGGQARVFRGLPAQTGRMHRRTGLPYP